jgi:hypothetical protein
MQSAWVPAVQQVRPAAAQAEPHLRRVLALLPAPEEKRVEPATVESSRSVHPEW